MEELIENLSAALKTRIENLDWMGAGTRKKAVESWASFTPKVGHPDKWREWDGLQTSRDSDIGTCSPRTSSTTGGSSATSAIGSTRPDGARARRGSMRTSHAPANFRAIGAPSDLTQFAAAFNGKPGQPMVRRGDQQVVIG